MSATGPAPAYRIQNRDIHFPVVVRDAFSASATFAVSSAAARRLLPGREIDVAEVWPGRCLMSLAIIDYKDNDLGDYNEVSIAFFVRPSGASGGIPYLGSVIDMMRGNLGTYIHHLPVNQSFTCEAGCAIWGFPKTVQEIDFAYREKEVSCKLVYDGQHALTLTVPRAAKTRPMPDRELTTFTYIEGVAHQTVFTSGADALGVSFGGATLEVGEGRVAEELRSLGLPKGALLCTTMDRMHGTFLPATKL